MPRISPGGVGLVLKVHVLVYFNPLCEAPTTVTALCLDLLRSPFLARAILAHFSGQVLSVKQKKARVLRKMSRAVSWLATLWCSFVTT